MTGRREGLHPEIANLLQENRVDNGISEYYNLVAPTYLIRFKRSH